MIDKNVKLVDLTRLSEFKELCDKAYAKKGESFDPSLFSEYVTDDDVDVDDVLASIFMGEWVDLGLPSGTKWAKCNIGAAEETDSGDYFPYGKNVPYKMGDDTSNYKTGSINVFPIGTPTVADFDELVQNTDSEWTTINGVNGMKYMRKDNNKVYIFLPASGYYSHTSVADANIVGVYTQYASNAKVLSNSEVSFDAADKSVGRTIRLIQK